MGAKGMIRWSSELYMDDFVRKNPEKWKKKVEQGKLVLSIYCICLASNKENLLDIINCNELLFRHYRNGELYIVGMARSREDAVDLVQDIVEHIYQKTQDVKIREYFEFREEG